MEMVHRTFLIEKTISLPLVLGAAFILSPLQILTLFIVLGQGHHLISYFYQYKAGRITRKYILLYGFVLTFLLTLLLYFNRVDLIIILAGIHFLVHFLFDEFFLNGKTVNSFRLLEAAPVLLLYAGFIIDLEEFTNALPFFAVIAGILMGIYILSILIGKRYSDYISVYLWFIACALLILLFLNVRIPLEILLGVPILLHHSEWYIQYYFKVRDNSEKLKTYLRRVLIINIIVLSLYIVYRVSDYFDPILIFAFIPAYFYIGALLHTLFSTRSSDFAFLKVGG